MFRNLQECLRLVLNVIIWNIKCLVVLRYIYWNFEMCKIMCWVKLICRQIVGCVAVTPLVFKHIFGHLTMI
jgi:hypothetical protein